MNGINERIKHATTVEEIDALLRQGEQQKDATQRTLNRRNKLAANRRAELLRNHRYEKQT